MPDARTEAAEMDGSDRVVQAARMQGFALLPTFFAEGMQRAEWHDFAADWNTLPLDRHMGDGGRYRRRRYGAFRTAEGEIERLPHRAHFQDRQFNPLNGGYDRWFAPIGDHLAGSRAFTWIMGRAFDLVERLGAPAAHSWDVEAHQFRIEAFAGQAGLPTPEGPHRDGRDWVFLVVVARHNVFGGETHLHDDQGIVRWSRTLAAGEGVLIDDRRWLHGTSPIRPLDAPLSAKRDVLILTFAAEHSVERPATFSGARAAR